MKATRRHRHGAVASETHTMSKRLGSLTLHDWRVSPQRCSPSWRRSREDGRTTRTRRASPEHTNHTSQHTAPHRTAQKCYLFCRRHADTPLRQAVVGSRRRSLHWLWRTTSDSAARRSMTRRPLRGRQAISSTLSPACPDIIGRVTVHNYI